MQTGIEFPSNFFQGKTTSLLDEAHKYYMPLFQTYRRLNSLTPKFRVQLLIG